jgi:hypothetical protein
MDPLVRVLSNVTPEQARLLWRLLGGYVEDETIEGNDDCAEMISAAALLAACDAAMASFAEQRLAR